MLKKSVLIVISICLVFVFSGCTSYEVEEDYNRSEVMVYSPNGENVNGYKVFDDGTGNGKSNGETFVANTDSKTFHKSTCGSAKIIKESNKYSTSNRQELIDSGYSPCQRCKP